MTPYSEQYPQQASYFDDVTGELCDAWRAEGLTFSVSEDGVPHCEESTTENYDPSYFISIRDIYGTPQRYLDSSHDITKSIARVQSKLPKRHLIYASDASDDVPKLCGIKIESLPEVKELVENAETTIPPGQQVYRPKGVIVISEQTKRGASTFLAKLMSSPEEAAKTKLLKKESGVLFSQKERNRLSRDLQISENKSNKLGHEVTRLQAQLEAQPSFYYGNQERKMMDIASAFFALNAGVHIGILLENYINNTSNDGDTLSFFAITISAVLGYLSNRESHKIK